MKLTAAAGIVVIAIALASAPASGQTWNLQTVDDAGDMGYDSQIVTSSDGTPYIFYRGDNALRLAWWVSGGGDLGGWQYKTLDSNTYNGLAFEVLVDGLGRFHLAWSRYTAPNIKYGVYDPATASWVLGPETVTGGLTYSHVDLALADVGGSIWPCVLFNKDSDPVYLARRNPGTGVWTTTAVDAAHTASGPSSITVDSMNNLHVSYYEDVGDNLMYATKTWDATTWQLSTVDVTGNVGSWSSIAVTAGDVVHIVYYDTTNGDLKYATLVP